MVLSRNVENSTKWSFYCLTWQQWGVNVVNYFQIIDDMSDNYAEIIEDVSDEDNDDQVTLLPGHWSSRAGRYFSVMIATLQSPMSV